MQRLNILCQPDLHGRRTPAWVLTPSEAAYALLVSSSETPTQTAQMLPHRATKLLNHMLAKFLVSGSGWTGPKRSRFASLCPRADFEAYKTRPSCYPFPYSKSPSQLPRTPTFVSPLK